uniref:Importin subunit beta-1/Transportin-1-like TPR repeats domain-containing protein n=1 Tax=Triticum urartu TaxID=4572 RepID=A0A8R7TXU7_TRIUA
MHCIMKRLDMTLDRQALNLGHKLKKNNLQIVLCGVLQVIVQRLANSATVKIVTNAAHHLLFSFCRVLVCDSSTAQSEAMCWFAIAALANATGPEFGKHMPILMQVLMLTHSPPSL